MLTYRQTEFEELPVIPLMFMIHEEKLEKSHNFFFMRLSELIPELNTVETMIIATENGEAVSNAIKKYIPHVTMYRNWQHALQDINKNLRDLEITECQEVKEYESDFIRLLDQESCGDYKSILAQMYLKKWKRVKTYYFPFLNFRIEFTHYRLAFLFLQKGVLQLFRRAYRYRHEQNGCLGFTTVWLIA